MANSTDDTRAPVPPSGGTGASGPRSYRRLSEDREEWPPARHAPDDTPADSKGEPTRQGPDTEAESPAEGAAAPEGEGASPPPPEDTGDSAPDELLAVSEVAQRAGVHENTVRKYLKAGGIPFFLRDLATGEIVAGDAPQDQWPSRYQYLLSAEVVAHLASHAGDTIVPSAPPQLAHPPSTTSSQALSTETSRLRSDLAEAQHQLTTAHDQLAELRTDRDWLRSHLRDITAFLPAAKEETDHVRSDLEALEQRARDLEHARDLERQARRLAVLRFKALPWWRRARADFEALVQDELDHLSDRDT